MTNYQLFKTKDAAKKFEKKHGGVSINLSIKKNQKFYEAFVGVTDFEKWQYSVEWNGNALTEAEQKEFEID